MDKTARDVLNASTTLKDGLISCMNDFAKQAFEAARKQHLESSKGNWNQNDFSDYETFTVNDYETFEDYLNKLNN